MHEGERLHLRLESDLGDGPASVVLRHRRTGRVTATVPVEAVRGEAQLAVALEDLGIHRPGEHRLFLRVGARTLPVAYAGAAPKPSAIAPHPFSVLSGLSGRPAMTRTGQLVLQVRTTAPTVHVSTVNVGPGVIRVGAVAFLHREPSPARIVHTLRGTGVAAAVDASATSEVLPTGMHRIDLTWAVPTTKLSTLVTEPPVGELIWDVTLDLGEARLPVTRQLGDISTPRRVFRYRTVVDASTPHRDRFRPYWTKGGRLAIEQLRGVKQ